MIAPNNTIELDDDLLDKLADIIVDKITAKLLRPSPGPAIAPTAASPLLSRKQIAKELKVSLATVDRLMRSKAIPFIRVGTNPRFRLPDVMAAMKSAE